MPVGDRERVALGPRQLQYLEVVTGGEGARRLHVSRTVDEPISGISRI
jgi:hypothetical protein